MDDHIILIEAIANDITSRLGRIIYATSIPSIYDRFQKVHYSALCELNRWRAMGMYDSEVGHIHYFYRVENYNVSVAVTIYKDNTVYVSHEYLIDGDEFISHAEEDRRFSGTIFNLQDPGVDIIEEIKLLEYSVPKKRGLNGMSVFNIQERHQGQ